MVTAVGAAEYFDVEVRQGQIVLTPVRIQRGDAVRAKLAELGLSEADLAQAVRWGRSSSAGYVAAEPAARYEKPVKAAAPSSKKSPKRK